MVDRTDGYVTAVGYTHGYYSVLNPLRARLAFLNAGLHIGPIATACELGFGQGVSIACHAAASPTRWHGNDFNAEHVRFARELAAASGTEIGLHQDTFEAFAGRSDLPAFDYIGLHGVWSWISDRNRSAIVAFVRRKLRPGGIVYLGYNALPGWSALAPIRHLLVEHASRAEAGLGIVRRVDAAVAFFDALLAAEPAYSRDNPQVAEWFATLKDGDRRYLAHEFFNDHWAPMYVAEVARWLAPAGLSYACSAAFPEHMDAASLSPVQREMLEKIQDPLLRESTRDFMVNRVFRQDYWVRQPRTLSDPERIAALRAERVVLASPRLPRKVRAILALNQAGWYAACEAVLGVLADHKPRTLGEIEQVLGPMGHDLAQIVDAAVLIASCGNLMAAQDDAVAAGVRSRTDMLNAHLIERARTQGDVQHLVSPVIGGGIEVGREQQLFLSALKQGKTRAQEWVEEAATYLGLPHDDDGLNEEASAFANDALPLLRAFQIL